MRKYNQNFYYKENSAFLQSWVATMPSIVLAVFRKHVLFRGLILDPIENPPSPEVKWAKNANSLPAVRFCCILELQFHPIWQNFWILILKKSKGVFLRRWYFFTGRVIKRPLILKIEIFLRGR